MTNLWRLSIWNYQHSKKKCVNSNKDPLSTCKSKYQTLQALIHKQHHTITKNNKYFLKNSAGFYKIPKSRRHLVVHINRGCNSALRINGVDHYAVRINGVIVLVSLYARINGLDHLYGRRIYIYGLQHIYLSEDLGLNMTKLQGFAKDRTRALLRAKQMCQPLHHTKRDVLIWV